MAAAAKAFSLGQQAELAGDHRAASEHYELADRMVPSPEALRSAVKTRLKAGDDAIAATHAEALARRYRDERSQEIAADLLKKLRPRLARVSLGCTPSCGALADGGAIGVEEASEHVFYLEPGQHTVAADFGTAGSRRQIVDARAGKTITIDLAAPQEAAAVTDPGADVQVDAASSRSSGLSRAWFVAGAAVTVGLAGATIWSGLDVLDRNDAYELEPTLARLEDGQSAERRTNILLGATAAAAVGTGVIALFTRWSSSGEAESAPPAATVSVAPVGGGAVLLFEGGFR